MGIITTKGARAGGVFIIPTKEAPGKFGVCVAIVAATGTKREFLPPQFATIKQALQAGETLAKRLKKE